MSDWLKLVECKHTPTRLFTIFDYTKVVYPIDSGLCLRQIINASQKTIFIDINHSYDEIIAIYGVQNNLVTVERKDQYYFICQYGVAAEQVKVRLSLTVEGKIVVRSVYNEGLLMLCFSCNQSSTNELIFFDCNQKSIIAKGLVEGSVLQAKVGPNSSISLLLNNKIVAYKNQPMLDQTSVGRIYKQIQPQIRVQFAHHVWLQDQLLIWQNNKIYLIAKNKIIQEINDFYKLHNVITLAYGFLACDGSVIKVYKKKQVKYQFICDFFEQHLMNCQNVCLTPQEDVIAYFSEIANSIFISTSFSQQIQQFQFQESKQNRTLNLKANQISHEKVFDYTVYASSQPWFAAANGTKIQLISSTNYEKYLQVELQNKNQPNFPAGDAKIRYIGIHPCRPIIAVALRKVIRIYLVAFNEVRLLKQLNYSNCGYLLFNRGGSLLTAVVAGKGGAKIYIFKLNQFKLQFNLIEAITVARKPISMFWDNLDSKLFCVFKEGYYDWPVQHKFKMRNQYSFAFNFQVLGAIITKDDYISVWGNSNVAVINNQQILSEQTIKNTKIKQIYLQGEWYYFILTDGRIAKNKILQIESCLSKAFDLSTKGNNFQICLQESSKFILISAALNLRFYQFGSSYNHFSDIVSIERRKLYTIMNKHHQYEKQIKQIKHQFAVVLAELKNQYAIEQGKKQKQYKIQLKDHVDREKRVKDEKTKLQEMMEYNIELKQRQAMNQIKDLQRLYQRKIALTTNKLLTEQQIGFRDKMTAQNNLKIIEDKHSKNVEEIRKQFGEQLKKNILDKNQAQKAINRIKRQYESRLYQLEEENQILLKDLQEKNENSVLGLKRMVNNWENKFSECISKKDNVEKQLQEQMVANHNLKQKINFVETRKMESERRCEHLTNQIAKMSKVLQQRNKKLQLYEKRIQDLQKSNEILKYRVLQVKQQSDPYQDEIIKLKSNLTELQEEYDKIVKHSHQQDQKLQILKKQRSKLKQDFESVQQKYMKLTKRHQQMLDKVRQTAKAPIQQIRKQLLVIIETYVQIQKSYSVTHHRADSPLGELNRIRDHLQVCLEQAVTSSKKNQQQKKIQIIKKSHQNSQLILQINTMRKKIRQLQDLLKQKDLKIARIMRGETPPPISQQPFSANEQKISTTQAESKHFTKTRSKERETFYEKSLFKSKTQWNQRLKTQQSSRRKKSSHSMMRDRNPNGSLSIYPATEQIEQYKRIIEQKDVFIRKLISKIQKN